MHSSGRIIEIWRYPVSSLGGERVASACVNAGGIAGDRQYALIDAATGIPAAPEKDLRWRKALHLRATSGAGNTAVIHFPDGTPSALNDPALNERLSDYFGFAAALATHASVEAIAGLPVVPYRHHHFPLHLLTTSSLAHLAALRQVATIDVRRFRPSVLLDTGGAGSFLEDRWIGQGLWLGGVELQVAEATKRCGMTFIAQPKIDDDPDILRTILRHNKRHLGVYCAVQAGGTLETGADVRVSAPQAQASSVSIGSR